MGDQVEGEGFQKEQVTSLGVQEKPKEVHLQAQLPRLASVESVPRGRYR
jgi:hypothetical protein